MIRDKAEKNIGRFRLGGGAPPTIIARFQRRMEERPAVSEPTKPSLLARLHLTFPRKTKLPPKSFNGTRSQPKRPPLSTGQLFVAPTQRPDSRASSKTNPLPFSSVSPGLIDCEDSTAEFWQKAVQEEARLRNLATNRPDGHNRRSSYPDGNLHKHPLEVAIALKRYRSSLAIYSDARKDEEAAGNTPSRPTPADTQRGQQFTPTRSWSNQAPSHGSPSPESSPASNFTAGPSQNSKKAHAQNFSRIPESWARFPSHSQAERNLAISDTNISNTGPTTQKHPIPIYTRHRSMTSIQPALRPASASLHGRFGKAVKSGLTKLMTSKALPGGGSPKSAKSGRKGTDKYKRGLEYPELEVLPTEDGYQELRALEHEIEHLRGLPRTAKCPAALQDSRSGVVLSTKMAAVLHTDGTAEPHLPKTPVPSHARDSTTASTDKFLTPLSNLSTNQDNSSFHSYPHSRAHSQGMLPLSGDTLAEMTSDAGSIRSDTILSKMFRSATASDVDSGFCGSMVGVARLETWNGRSKTLPFLNTEQLEQLDGLYVNPVPSRIKRLSLGMLDMDAVGRQGITSSSSVASL